MELTFVAKDPDSVPDGSPALYRTDRQSWIVQGWAVTDPAALAALNVPEGETCVEIPDRLIPYFQTPNLMRPSSLDELRQLCRGIQKSFVHLETRDSYGTETELPHLARWRRGEPDDYAWLQRWLEMLRGHRTAGRTCRRARVVSEPLSEYQQWVLSSAALFTDAGEDIRYLPRPRLTGTSLPGSGDFYVFDDTLVMFLHYAGNGTNTAFEITDEPRATSACQEAFDNVWRIATPLREYRPA